jgi:hypothetical protein
MGSINNEFQRMLKEQQRDEQDLKINKNPEKKSEDIR